MFGSALPVSFPGSFPCSHLRLQDSIFCKSFVSPHTEQSSVELDTGMEIAFRTSIQPAQSGSQGSCLCWYLR